MPFAVCRKRDAKCPCYQYCTVIYLEHAVHRVCKNCTSDPSRGLVYCKTADRMNKNYIKPFGTRNIKTGEEDEDLTRGGILPIVGYTGRLRAKRVPFLSSQYMKGQGKLPF